MRHSKQSWFSVLAAISLTAVGGSWYIIACNAQGLLDSKSPKAGWSAESGETERADIKHAKSYLFHGVPKLW